MRACRNMESPQRRSYTLHRTTAPHSCARFAVTFCKSSTLVPRIPPPDSTPGTVFVLLVFFVCVHLSVNLIAIEECILSYKEVQEYSPFWELLSDCSDFSNRVVR